MRCHQTCICAASTHAIRQIAPSLPQQLGIGGLSGGLDAAGSQGGHQEYNCFLNAIIQCLWRCTFFRQQVGLA